MLYMNLFKINMGIFSLDIIHCVDNSNIYAASETECISVFYILENVVNLVLRNTRRRCPGMQQFAPVDNVDTVGHLWELMTDILCISNMNGTITFLHYKFYLILKFSAQNLW
jgi:hypothetical protein